MLPEKRTKLEAFLRESKRTLPLLLFGLLVLFKDDSWPVLIFALGYISIILAFVHIFRKVIAPYLDMKQLAVEVYKENSIASALVLVGMFGFISVLIWAVTTLIAPH